MSLYRIELPFDRVLMDADMTHAAANIGWIDEDEDGERHSTQWQTADARHDVGEAAVLLIRSFGADYWCEPGVDVGDEDAYVRELILAIEEIEEDVDYWEAVR